MQNFSQGISRLSTFGILLLISYLGNAQTLKNSFESQGGHLNWVADDCGLEFPLQNPFKTGINTSNQVLAYHDQGGSYANIRFDIAEPFKLDEPHVFKLKVYVRSSSLSGNAPLQLSLKLQSSAQDQPWTNQTEIIKPLVADQWQEVTFNFNTDQYLNLNPNDLPPAQRKDFNRVLIQLNGENNDNTVRAYLDDFEYTGALYQTPQLPVYDYLVWSDEFDGEGMIDTSKWFHQTLLPNGDSWYNGEVQHYTNRIENSYLKDGYLHIKAKREQFTDQGVTKSFTSARLNSKFSFTYGKIECRVKLPIGVGTWPAIWMLGRNIQEPGGYFTDEFGTIPWPGCGEIDIMEHWGTNQNYVSSAIHTPSSFGGTVNYGGTMAHDVANTFHIFTCVWSPSEIVFSLNGTPYYTYKPDVQNLDTWPFFEPQYFLLNIAMQALTEPSFTESEMVIDYLRVYQSPPLGQQQGVVAVPVSIYPNPVAQGILHLRLTEAPQQALAKVYGLDGKLLLQQRFSSTYKELDVSALSEGTYLLQIELPEGIQTIKWIKTGE